MQSKRKKVVIIGSGIAGLSAALRLSGKGIKVEVFEKSKEPGGKLRYMPSLIGPIDAGPTVFTLKPWFDELFAEMGERLENHITISEQTTLARHWWPDGSTLDLKKDLEKNLALIKEFSGKKSAQEFERFYQKTKIAFDIFEDPIMRSPEIKYLHLAKAFLKNPMKLSNLLFNFRNLWEYLALEFSDPKLQQLFARYSTYVGTSPFKAPALLALIWQAEARGVWQILGGMNKLPKAMEKLAKKKGVVFKYQSEIAHIEVYEGEVKGVIDTSNEYIPADKILFNGDPAAVQQGLLGKNVEKCVSKLSVSDRSLSAFVWSFKSTPKGKNLSLHNVFFNSDYKSEFKDIDKGLMPKHPSIYVCAQDRGISPNIGGAERFEIIINAAPNGETTQIANKKEEFEKCKKITFETLERMGLEFLEKPKIVNLTTPLEFQNMYPGSSGSLYGLSLSKTLSTLRRPTAKTKIKGLYLAGGGVHPGPGVPMALSSGKHAAEMIMNDLSLI